MEQDDAALNGIREALRRIPRMDSDGAPLNLSLAGGALTIRGEVSDVAVKRQALGAAASINAVNRVVDRLTVTPGETMGDRQIRDQFRDVLYREPLFTDFMLIAADRGSPTVLRRPAEAAGRIEYDIDRGIVTLDGSVPTAEHKRLAGVLAWWVPGRRDVINTIAVETGESNDAETMAVWVKEILDRDEHLDASAIHVVAENEAIHLSGQVSSAKECDQAEFDAWYIDGVESVINAITINL